MPALISTPSSLLPSAVPAAAHADLHAAMRWIQSHWPLGAPSTWRDHLDSMIWPLPAELRNCGFELWASGAERVVLFHQAEWCLKVPIGRAGLLANQDELMVLAAIAEEDREMFAETYCLDGYVLLQRTYAVSAARVLEHERTSCDIARAQRRLRLSDITPINVGWRKDGCWVFIDWAGSSHPNVFYRG